jgi:murein DD-endopeptidase MepM/ murein hydrolase activator NlpD
MRWGWTNAVVSWWAWAVVVVALATLTACEQVELVQDRFRDMTPYEAYEASLADVGLVETALGRDWIMAGREAVESPVAISLPFHEEGFITAEDPGAMAYRVTIGRGQRLTAEITLNSDEQTRVFLDFFRVPANEADPLRPVISSDSVPGEFVIEPWRGGEYVLRLQPELLRGGTYSVTLRLEAQLAFPVEGYSMRGVQSIFGADRDGGRRSHAGVDIFARRGTPVLATSAGRVNRVGITNLGGKVVWVRDPVRNSNIYFAHLDSQYVRDGDQVQIGDTLGFVGNTGNARTTPPHLHFGIYRSREGAVDPYPFLNPPRGSLAEQSADLDQLGAWVRLVNDGIRLRAAPGRSGAVLRELGQHTPLRVLGGSGEYFRVRSPEGLDGYVAARLTEPVDSPLRSQVSAAGGAVLLEPNDDALVMVWLKPGEEVPVLGRYEGFLYVRAPSGLTGWMDADEKQ